jgi:hypothetical protein
VRWNCGKIKVCVCREEVFTVSIQETIVNWLFETRAIRVCQPDQPFWYTSGTLGPYYINTHFLYGNEEQAGELLALIEACAADPLTMPVRLARAVQLQYRDCQLYRDLCDLVATWLRACTGDLISGGERRDFFFSIQAAFLLDKPHLSILKNGNMILSENGFSRHQIISGQDLKGQRAIHVADLVTEASSYQRAWLPAIQSCGATMPLTLAIVDRDQGGREWLSANGTELLALTRIDRDLFEQALQDGLIDRQQFDAVSQFIDSPLEFMHRFLASHPRFLSEQLALGGKNRERALLCMEKGYADPL